MKELEKLIKKIKDNSNKDIVVSIIGIENAGMSYLALSLNRRFNE